MLIGNKSSFGIEYQEVKSNFGLVRIWLNGNAIGSYNEEELITSIHYQLNRLLDRKLPIRSDIELERLDEVFDFIKNDISGQFDVTLLNLGSSFDDFLIRVISDHDSFIIAWELSDDPFFTYCGEMPKSDIVRVNFKKLKSVLDQFIDNIQNPNHK